MAVLTKLVVFDRPLIGASIAGEKKLYDLQDIARIREEAYHQGEDSGRAFADRQMVEFRHEIQQLQDGLFAHLPEVEQSIVRQLQQALPGLALELASRLIAGFEPTPEILEKNCREVLEQLYPERDNLELLISPKDAAMLKDINPSWVGQYPGLKITPDPSLSSGDCQVRSRFGITDARVNSKLETLARELLSNDS